MTTAASPSSAAAWPVSPRPPALPGGRDRRGTVVRGPASLGGATHSFRAPAPPAARTSPSTTASTCSCAAAPPTAACCDRLGAADGSSSRTASTAPSCAPDGRPARRGCAAPGCPGTAAPAPRRCAKLLPAVPGRAAACRLGRAGDAPARSGRPARGRREPRLLAAPARPERPRPGATCGSCSVTAALNCGRRRGLARAGGDGVPEGAARSRPTPPTSAVAAHPPRGAARRAPLSRSSAAARWRREVEPDRRAGQPAGRVRRCHRRCDAAAVILAVPPIRPPPRWCPRRRVPIATAGPAWAARRSSTCTCSTTGR